MAALPFWLILSVQTSKPLKSDTPVASQVSIGDNGDLVENTVRYNPVTKGWRLTLRLKVKDPKKADRNARFSGQWR